MPLDNVLCGLLESSLNKLQQLDSSAQQKRKVLDGAIIKVMLKELNKPLYFVISKQQIDVLSHYDGPTNCFIRLTLSALQDLQNNNQLPHLIKTQQLDVEGDVQIAQQFAQLLTEMEIDWEEHLANKIGDVLAHKFCYHSKQAKSAFASKLKKIEQHSAQFITEEVKLAPSALEVAYFCEQVSDLDMQSKHLQARIHHLLNG